MIFGGKKLKLRGVDRSVVTDGPMIFDHASAEQYGHQGIRKQPRIRSVVRISECQPDDSPAYYYYRVILMHGEKEFANLIINEEHTADLVLERLQEIRPEIMIGYDPNLSGDKPKFM